MLSPAPAFINAIGTAIPHHDVHQAFIGWARGRLADRPRALFDRMAARSGIAHRWSVLPRGQDGGSPIERGGFYADGQPGTGARMAFYAEAAPVLAAAETRGWTISQVWNTHWHPDHTGGNAGIKAATGARVTGPAAEAARIATLDATVGEGDTLRLGDHVATVMATPAHTAGHVSYHFAEDGVIFVDTPNIESRGARYWGRNWRGLETPRHLLLFSRAGLLGMLKAAGFESIQTKRRTAVRRSMYLASLRMQMGKSPDRSEPARLPWLMRLRLSWPVASVREDEFLTFLARKGRA